jgi:hypothetical protein
MQHAQKNASVHRTKERRKTETEDDERNQNIELKCIRREIKEL